MAILSAIRRWHFRDGASIREIARRSGLSRNTVRKYLQSKVVEPQYPARDSVGKLSPFEPKLRQWLSTEHKKTKKLRRNLRSMYRDLVALGFILCLLYLFLTYPAVKQKVNSSRMYN